MYSAKPYGPGLKILVERLASETAPDEREMMYSRLDGLILGFVNGRLWGDPDGETRETLDPEVVAGIEYDVETMLCTLYQVPRVTEHDISG